MHRRNRQMTAGKGNEKKKKLQLQREYQLRTMTPKIDVTELLLVFPLF